MPKRSAEAAGEKEEQEGAPTGAEASASESKKQCRGCDFKKELKERIGRVEEMLLEYDIEEEDKEILKELKDFVEDF